MTLMVFAAMLATYLGVALVVTYLVTRLGRTVQVKWVLGSATLLAFVALVVWDDVRGYFYLRHLCAKDGGFHVHRTVVLPQHAWRDDGSPIDLSQDSGSPFRRYKLKSSSATVTKWPELVRFERSIVDREENQVLGRFVDYFGERGWFVRAPGWRTARRSCGNARADMDRNLSDAVFRKAPSQ